MSGLIQGLAMQSWCEDAIKALVETRGTGWAATACRVHRNTIRRHLTGESPWTLPELCDLIGAERQDCGTRTVLDALSSADLPRPLGEPVRLRDDLLKDIQEEGELIRAEAEVAAGRQTTRTIRRLATLRAEHHLHEAQLEADLQASLQRTV